VKRITTLAWLNENDDNRLVFSSGINVRVIGGAAYWILRWSLSSGSPKARPGGV
jgi:hypothetical protein